MNHKLTSRGLLSQSDNRKSKIENRKWAGIFTIALTFAMCGAWAEAQQPKTVPLIGYLAGAGSGPSPAFLEGLRDLGYVEGKNIVLVFRTTEGKNERYSDLAAELVRLNVDIIVVGETQLSVLPRKPPAQSPSSC